jgi:hypothetical protein
LQINEAVHIMSLMSRIVLISCSRRKRKKPEALPAIERYDGPTFRVLRRFLRRRSEQSLDTYVLSSAFGLINAQRLIPHYDHEMTSERARELEPQVASIIGKAVSTKQYNDALICAGGAYTPILERCARETLPVRPHLASGTVGRQLTLLHQWLYDAPKTAQPEAVEASEIITVTVRGTEITLSPVQARSRLSEALAAGEGRPKRYQSWYVEVNEQPVSVKWAVAQLTGLAVADFHTSDAKRVLRELGIKVHMKG